MEPALKNLRINLRVDVSVKPTGKLTEPTPEDVFAGQKPTQVPTETYGASPT